MDALADTCFFIDLQRNRPNALFWLKANPTVRLRTSVVTYGELAACLPDRHALDQSLAVVPLLPIDLQIAWTFGVLARSLKASGNLIGPNDLWIAATALCFELPLLTRNVNELNRVAGLRVLSY